MTKIDAFRGYRYNPQKVGDLAAVMAPPYDVIDPPLQDKLYAKSPFNVVRIDLAKEENGLSRYPGLPAPPQHTWKQRTSCGRTRGPAIPLFQTYSLATARRLARRRLESFAEGGVKPHEQTFPGPKADRLKLMQATNASFSPIFALYPDPAQEAGAQLAKLSAGKPDLEIRDEKGDEHRLWRVDDAEAIARLLGTVRDRPLMIADGHHRYETALAYAEEQKALLGDKYTGQEPFNYVMMFLCALEDPGLVVLPTHRVLAQRPEMDEAIFRGLVSKYAKIKAFPVAEADAAIRLLEEEGAREHALGWVHDGKVEVLVFDVEKLLESQSLNHLHFAIRDLDVTVLHDLVLEELLGVSKGAQREYGNILYIKEAKEAIALAQEKGTYAFLMNATKLKQIEAVIAISEKMPQKSTFFYPKPLTGLVFYDFASA